MRKRIHILIWFAISCTIFSCRPQLSIRQSYFSDFSEEELNEKRAKERAYLDKLKKSQPDSVKIITLNWAFLDSSPDLSKFNKVYLISISGIEKQELDKSLFSSESLRIVELSYSDISKIEFPEDNHIERLNLSNNQLTRIPSNISRCKHLNALNVEGNQIRHIPKWIMELDSLEEINLNFNQLKLSKADVRHLSKVKQIIIGGNDMEKLPKNIGKLRCESMNLGKNKLHTLPKSFANLKHMKSLIFYENEFEEIPEVLADFKELKHLDFYKNNITEIPEFVGNLDGIQQLFLAFNKIETIPDTIRNLKHLKYFYIHHNELRFLPEWITEMDSIERFGVGYNHLLELPDLSKMKSLKDFDCEHNLLERFPWKLLEKSDMEMINARNNDFILSDEDEMRIIKANKTMNINY